MVRKGVLGQDDFKRLCSFLAYLVMTRSTNPSSSASYPNQVSPVATSWIRPAKMGRASATCRLNARWTSSNIPCTKAMPSRVTSPTGEMGALARPLRNVNGSTPYRCKVS
eukprot:scaffold11394_cov183-Amphora_coffeaeformis.AAC.5